eukprot:CAMPEP_0119321610 /NCGR_PEP_ID=MMETSP1333-20130426/55880_1 /TAXON_ID=418940 /ORGANISM="Scyphosphaera apsteinii, Strain RCC1455" /LENGTH=801 /DNA_ID=CAMNT_0007328617 /DNA_START=8 /DNA_END=2413 /DNA_ORIENTATION=+
MASKRRRDEEEPQVGIEQRLVNLIVRVGDKHIANIASHLRGLSAALIDDLAGHRQLIIDTVFDCVRALQPKAPVYGALVGLLNARDPRFGTDVAHKAQRELQNALDDHAPLSIRGLCRFVVELMNARVVTPSYALDVLESFAAVRLEPDVLPARALWFLTLVADAIVLGGSEFSLREATRLDELLGAIRLFQETSISSNTPTLLLPYGSETKPDHLTEHFETLWQLVSDFWQDGSWRSPLLLSPSRAFADELAEKPVALDSISVPLHTLGCTYPSLRRLRLFNDSAGSKQRSATDAESKVGPLPLGERILLEEYVWMLVNSFSESHKDCAKQLMALREAYNIDGVATFIEVIMSMLLLLPAPRNALTYYACLLLDLSKVFPSAPHLLETAVNKLFSLLPYLDAELTSRFADWLALHVSHFSFNFAPFGASWAQLLSLPADANGDSNEMVPATATLIPPAADSAYRRFTRQVLDKCMRLSYHERVVRELPAPLVPLMPPLPKGATAWAQVQAEDTEPGSLAAKSATLLNRLRSKTEPRDVLEWLDSHSIGKEPFEVQLLVIHTLLDAGSKSISHLEKLLDKFDWLLNHITSDAAGRVSVASAVASYWATSSQMVSLVMSKMLMHGFVDGAAVIGWLCSSDGRPRLAMSSSWEVVYLIIDKALASQRAASEELRIAEQRYAERGRDAMDDDDDDMASVSEQRVAAKREELARERRDKKALFANIYVGVCTVLSEHARTHAGGWRPNTDEWSRLCVGHVRAVGRRYLPELSLSGIEMVIEGSDVEPVVQEAIFEGLRSLHAWQV